MRTGANGVATVTMVRSDKHNALDQAMFEGLMNAAEQLANDASVRAVVLHGEGKSFCSGLDIASFMSGGGGTGVLLARDDDRLANFAQRVTYDWSLVSAPVIAAIHGNCFGGGLQIALGADIRIAAPDAKLCIMEIKWGLVPDMGITQTLPRLIPIDVAKELTFTGRIVSGSEGFDLGLVTRTASGDFCAISASASADASGSSAVRVTNPSATLAPGNDAAGERQLFRDVDRYESRQRLRDAHVGNEAPLDLHDPTASRPARRSGCRRRARSADRRRSSCRESRR